ncbi:MAG TPA: sugar phosphate isomerase/epimerase [Gemmatimonadaceae bacterium]|nr:sugar phosphate isomerase/epimerase [Gemmatimonadaceae bacterium]
MVANHFDTPISRRDALALLGVAGIGGLSWHNSLFRAPVTRWGVQLYTLRSIAGRDLEGTLKTLAEIGYREVETHTYYNRTAADIRKALDDAGLVAPSMHTNLNALTTNLPRLLEEANTIGHKWLIVASLPGSLTSTADGFKQAGEQLAKAAAAAKPAGIRVGFHNHAGEFKTFPVGEGGREVTGMDLLLQSSPADAVFVELDVYWIVKGGADPLAFLDKHRGRVKLLHLKDASAAPEIAMRDVGAGTINWPEVMKRADAGGAEHAFVEHDSPGDAVASVRASFEYLSKLKK